MASPVWTSQAVSFTAGFFGLYFFLSYAVQGFFETWWCLLLFHKCPASNTQFIIVLCWFWCVLILVGKVGSKNKEDAPYELESQFILRLPSVRLLYLQNWIEIQFDCKLEMMWAHCFSFFFPGVRLNSKKDCTVEQYEHERQTHHRIAP